MITRPCTTDDLPPILDIMNDAILHSTALYDYNPRTLENVKKWFAEKQLKNFPVIVADEAGQTIGFGTYGDFRTRDAYRFSVEHSIYIADGQRGKGIGTILLKELIALARTGGFHTMIGGVDAENLASINFHAQHGFTEVGRIREVGYKFDRWLDLVFMQLWL